MYKSNTKLKLVMSFFIFFFIIIIIYLYNLMINNNKSYTEKLLKINNKYVYGSTAPRGKILDINGNILVDNKLIPILIYSKEDKSSTKKEIELARKVNELISVDISNITTDDKKNFFLLTNKNNLLERIGDDVLNKYKNRKITTKEFNNILKDKITDQEISLYNDDDLGVIAIYNLMNSGYSYDTKVIKRDLTSLELASILESISSLNGFATSYDWDRVYNYDKTLKSVLGRVSTAKEGIPKDNVTYYSEVYNLNDRVGISGIEKQYDDYLMGSKAKYKVLDNNTLELVSDAVPGNDLVLSIDINLQKEVDKILEEEILYAKKEANTEYYKGSYVVITNPKTGGIMAISGMNAIKNDNSYSIIDATRSIFVNPMTPGSIVKGASMIVGYTSNSIQIGEYLKDECIKIKGTPKKCSHANLGLINDIDALAYSSNVYQFLIAMRLSKNNYFYNMSMKASIDDFTYYRNIFNQFGLGVLTNIDFPNESVGNIGKKTSPGLLLDFAMGQYDTYTVMQMSQYITTIANNGERLLPHLVNSIHSFSNTDGLGNVVKEISRTVLNKVETDPKYISRVQEGFKAVMSYGLGKGVMGTSPNPAGKTGTSETFLDTNNDGVIDTESISNAFIGYAPADNPVMTITVTSPDISIPNGKSSYFSYVNRRLAKKISTKFFELYPN